MPTTAKSPSQIVGESLRALRVERDQRQDEVASEARALGLSWTRATVAAIETGRREVSFGEALVIPWIYGVELADLIPRTAAVQVTADMSASGHLVQAALRGQALKEPFGSWKADEADEDGRAELSDRLMRRVQGSRRLQRVWPEAPPAEVLAAGADASNEVETRAARRLGAPPLALALAARRRWGHSLTEERDLRAPDGMSSRGHITRGLLDELRPDLEAAGLIKKGR